MDVKNLVSKNQSIKIVPTLEVTLENMGLNVKLDKNTATWFQQLQHTWRTWKKSPTIMHHLELFFQTNPDPYRIALLFIIMCKEFKDCKPKTLPFFIIETLQKWSCESSVIPRDCLKIPAFRIATEQKNQHFLNMMVKTYQIDDIKEIILPLVKNMIKSNNCKQASQVVIAMELFDDISVEELLFPLILQDKSNMIDEYLSECPNQVRPLLDFLDKLLNKNFNVREYAQTFIEEYKISHVRYEKLHHKPLGKLVGRLCNKFNIPVETCKNLSKNRTIGGLKYLIYQKYVEHKVSTTVWNDLVKDSLTKNSDSAIEFINILSDYDKKEAAKWVKYFKLPETLLPQPFRQMSLNEHVPSTSKNWELEDNPGVYYEFSLPVDKIVMIDSVEKFFDLCSMDFSGFSIVSIDCEWKPSFGAAQSHVALVQIATNDHVYLIDTLVLNNQQYSSLWNSLNKSLLDNPEIIKLGFGLEQDLKEMKGSIAGLSNIKVKGEGLLDLSILWKNLISFGLSLEGSSSSTGNSLSSFVQTCFGLPLKKTEQCSNWEIRPLRSTQIEYAALDAYVLIELYNFLQKQCLEQDINFEEMCNNTMLDTRKKGTKKQKDSVLNLQTKGAMDIKLFVETKLTNLIPYLRHCGVDTMIMPTTMLWHDIINLAISEDRFILLAKLKYTPMKKYPQTSILELHGGSIHEQLMKVLSCFNVKVNKDDLISRCINCNKKDLKKLTTDDVVELCKNYQCYGSMISNKSNYANNDDDEDSYYDNFLTDTDDDEDIIYGPIQTQTENHCLTSKGVPIEIKNFEKLSASPQSAVICESCGKLFWDGEDLFQTVNNLVLLLVNS